MPRYNVWHCVLSSIEKESLAGSSEIVQVGRATPTQAYLQRYPKAILEDELVNLSRQNDPSVLNHPYYNRRRLLDKTLVESTLFRFTWSALPKHASSCCAAMRALIKKGEPLMLHDSEDDPS